MEFGKKVAIFDWDGAEIRPLEMGRKSCDNTIIRNFAEEITDSVRAFQSLKVCGKKLPL